MAVMTDPLDAVKRSLAGELLRRTGFLRLRVLGQSMLPDIWPGDVLTIQSETQSNVDVGEVALLERDDRFFVHRVRSKVILNGSVSLVTRGDSSSTADPLFGPDALLGKVIRIEHGDRVSIPSAKLSLYGRALGWLFCHFSTVRNLALTINRREAADTGPVNHSAGRELLDR